MKWISKAKKMAERTGLESVRPRLCAPMSANLCGFAAMRAAENQWY